MILVTGAGGTIGAILVKLLAGRQGVPFRAAYRSEAKRVAAEQAGVGTVSIDFERPDTVARSLAGVNQLFLLSASGPEQAEHELAVVAAAEDAGVEHVVKLSVWGAPDESFASARVHRMVEREIEGRSLAWTFLRPNGFMQNFHNFMGDTIRKDGVFYSCIGESRISHVNAKDVAAAAAECLLTSGHTRKSYELSGPQSLSYAEAAKELSRASGRGIRYVDEEESRFFERLLEDGVPGSAAERYLELLRYYRTGAGAVVTDDVTRLIAAEPGTFAQYANEHRALFV